MIKSDKCQKPVFKCNFCKRAFSVEARLMNHLCEPKRRYLQKDDKPVRLAYMAYEHFYKRSMNKPTNYESFSKSTLYAAFVRFGRHLIDLNAIKPMKFVDFLIHTETAIDRWTNIAIYSTYIRELNKNEVPLDAIERNFMLMQQWSISSGEEWREFFYKVEPPQAVLWIINGRLSPWLLFTASSAHALLSRLTPEQITVFESNIDADFWKLKIGRHKEEVDTIRLMLAEYGI